MSITALRDIQHWVFDMDGTLTHAVHDFDDIRKQLELPEGIPILESLAKLPAELAAEKNQRLDEIEFEIAEQAVTQPGGEALLQQLIELGCDVGIVTRNGKAIAHATLKACGLDQYFADDSVIGRECAAPKPAPDGVSLLLKRWQANPAKAVMIGDYVFDLVAGKDAGTATVHFAKDSRGNWPDCTDYKVDSLIELLDVVKT